MPVRPNYIYEDPRFRPQPRTDVRPEVRPALEPQLTERQLLDRFKQSVRTYPNWTASQYETSTKRTFTSTPRTQGAYENALFDAAREKKPVVLMVGRSSDPATRHVVDNSMRQSRAASANQAAFVFVDLDKIDPGSTIGKFASQVERDKGGPYTMVFTQKAGDDKSPTRSDAPLLGQSGALRSEKMAEAISRGRLTMNDRQFPNLPIVDNRVRPVDYRPQPAPGADTRPPVGPSTDRGGRGELKPPAGVNMETLTESVKLLDQAVQKIEEKKVSYELFRKSIETADRSGDKALAGITRVELGLACFRWGFPEQGAAWLLDAGKNSPELYSSPKFTTRLQSAGLPEGTINLLKQEGQKNSQWYMSDKKGAIERIKATLGR